MVIVAKSTLLNPGVRYAALQPPVCMAPQYYTIVACRRCGLYVGYDPGHVAGLYSRKLHIIGFQLFHTSGSNLLQRRGFAISGMEQYQPVLAESTTFCRLRHLLYIIQIKIPRTQ